MYRYTSIGHQRPRNNRWKPRQYSNYKIECQHGWDKDVSAQNDDNNANYTVKGVFIEECTRYI